MKTALSQIIFALLIKLSICAEKEGDNPLEWLRNAIPGEPGSDYPILASVQETSFTCSGLIFGGYYADPETSCQQYAVCLRDSSNPTQLYPVQFLCPNGTIFKQELFTCDWWFNVNCDAATGFYGLAEGAFGTDGGESSAGTCPAAEPLSPAECEGSASTCWSPGQRDTDCPFNGLCCFNGCSNTCDQAQDTAQAVPGYNYAAPEVTLPVRPVVSTTPQALYQPPARSARRLTSRRLSDRRNQSREKLSQQI